MMKLYLGHTECQMSQPFFSASLIPLQTETVALKTFTHQEHGRFVLRGRFFLFFFGLSYFSIPHPAIGGVVSFFSAIEPSEFWHMLHLSGWGCLALRLSG